MKSLVSSVREIEGTQAVFIALKAGTLVAREAPKEFSRASLEALALEIDRLFLAYQVSLTDVEELFIRYSERALYGRRSSGLILGVIGQPYLDLDSIRIASDLCLREAAVAISNQADAAHPKSTSELPAHPPSAAETLVASSWERITGYLKRAADFLRDNAYTVRVYRYGYFRALDLAPLQVVISRVSIDPLFDPLQRVVAQKLLEASNRYESTAWSDFERLVKEAIATVAQIEEIKR